VDVAQPVQRAEQGRYGTIGRSDLRWSLWATGLSGENLVRFVRDEVFPFFTEVAADSASVNFMHGARLVIDDPGPC
jgi:type I restriction enzyme M protein